MWKRVNFVKVSSDDVRASAGWEPIIIMLIPVETEARTCLNSLASVHYVKKWYKMEEKYLSSS